MRTMNKVFLAGNLGADVDLRQTQDGTSVAIFRLATSKARKLDDGSWEERVDWHRVKAFGTLADRCGTYLAKGAPALVEGRLVHRSYETEDKVRKWITEVVAYDVVFLPWHGRKSAGSDAPQPEADVSF